MKLAIMTFRRGKTIVQNRVEEHKSMTLEQLKRNYSAEPATPEQMQKDKVELPGPEWKVLKARRYYVAFKED